MKITEKLLRDMGACIDGILWVREQETDDLKELLTRAISNGRQSDAKWLLSRLMDKKQCVEWAVLCAESVLPIFTERYPDDDRPAKAIAAAKAWILNPSATAADAARAAADAAAYADAAYASAAAYAADAAYASAAAASASAAYAAAYAAANGDELLWAGYERLGTK